MLYLSLADTERLDIRMAEVVPFIDQAFRLAGPLANSRRCG